MVSDLRPLEAAYEDNKGWEHVAMAMATKYKWRYEDWMEVVKIYFMSSLLS